MNDSATTASSSNPLSNPNATSLLCVDDDADTLASLQRLFGGAGYRVQVADDAAAGLLALEAEPIDLVISDMRSLEMGTRFLHQVSKRWPDTLRFMLTAEADVASILKAINHGEISRYITKPWIDAELLNIVAEAVQRLAQQREKRLISDSVSRRNEELKALNFALEKNVSTSLDELSAANARLQTNLIVTLKVFASLIESRHQRLAGHSRRVADLARRLATELKLGPALVQEVFFAALLHEVGKLGFSDELLNTPVAEMNPRQLREYRLHAGRAEQLLMPLQDLRGAAASIGAQLERFDGAGFPNQLEGRAIQVGARILSVCADFDNLQTGVLAPRRFTPKEAVAMISSSRGKRYDPWVVEAFVNIVGSGSAFSAAEPPVHHGETQISARGLLDGMILARDLVAPGGMMMLSAGNPIDTRLIAKIVQFEKSVGATLSIYIRSEGAG